MAARIEAVTLLGPGDPAPAEIVNPDGRAALVLTCDHAGRAIPAALGDLGLPAAELDRHIAFDPGIAPVARTLAARLDACLVLQPYSRLVIDCNRPADAPDLAPALADGTPVPGNAALSLADRQARWQAVHAPYHRAIATALDARAGQPGLLLIALHSFTPRLRGGPDRPWHAGFCANRGPSCADALLAALRARQPDLVLARDQPYPVEDTSDYTIPVHGERRGLGHALVELRQDLIADAAGQALWAERLALALADCLDQAGRGKA
jgi:predicted N-formylglutamate amidohydrolase